MTFQPISYGTTIRCGVYRVQARFTRAVNFVCGDKLVALVTPAVGDGPLNIVVPSLESVTDTSVLVVTRTHVALDGVAHAKRHVQRYRARVPVKRSDTQIVMHNVRHCAAVVQQHAPAHSIVRLMTDAQRSRFTQCLAARLRHGVRQMQRGAFAAGARTLKGLGCGLTPSGDDFLTGFLLGCRVVEQLHGVDLRATRRTILTHALGGSPLSNAFLRCAAAGRPFAPTHALLQALAQPNTAAVRTCTMHLLAVGATSGADTAAGLLCALSSARLWLASDPVWSPLECGSHAPAFPRRAVLGVRQAAGIRFQDQRSIAPLFHSSTLRFESLA
jgi:hypothetical protein